MEQWVLFSDLVFLANSLWMWICLLVVPDELELMDMVVSSFKEMCIG